MSLGRIESWIYSSGTVGLRAATSDLTIAETAGVTETFCLSGPMRLSDALMDWQTQLNASVGLANAYSLTWNSTAQAVTIARSLGVRSFVPSFSGNLAAVLGFSGSLVAGTTFTGTTPSLARFDGIRVGASVYRPGERVDLREYRHGRSEALCFGNHDICDVKVLLPKTQAERFSRSYCAAGRIRIYRDQTLVAAYAPDYPQGYTDGYVLSVSRIRTIGGAEEWVEFELRLGVPRA